MDLSGSYIEINPYFQNSETNVTRLKLLLKGDLQSISWDDYIEQFPNKEVVVPVRDQNNQVIGAIVRGVIE